MLQRSQDSSALYAIFSRLVHSLRFLLIVRVQAALSVGRFYSARRGAIPQGVLHLLLIRGAAPHATPAYLI